MKLLFLIADGMGDWPVESLGGRTPMEVALTPVMDRLAAEGAVGLCRTVPEGMPPGSDVANMALLGYDPAAHHTGRGPIEAAAQGLELAGDDLVWRLNVVTVTDFGPDGIMRDYSSGHITTEVSKPLIEDFRKAIPALDGATFEVHPGVQYRHLLVHKGGASQPEARLAVRPPHDITDKPIAQDWTAFESCPRFLALLKDMAVRLALPHNVSKANAPWPWGQGRALTLPAFEQTHGLRGAVVSAVDLVKGLGRAAGMAVLEVEGATGLLDTNYEGKVAAALDFLKSGGEYVYVHVEAPDECGHGGQVADKVESIARFDARIVGPILDGLAETMQTEPVVVVIACDHLTPLAIRTHASDPVPFLVWRSGSGKNGTAATFSEATAAQSGLFLDEGKALIEFAKTF